MAFVRRAKNSLIGKKTALSQRLFSPFILGIQLQAPLEGVEAAA